jgi:oligo-1,6-glucosidase
LVDPTREELDMVFTFQHMHIDRKPGDVNGRWALQKPDFVELKRIMADWQTQLSGRGWNALYFENHDRARVISRWGNDSTYRYECATAFATILHGMQGTPYVYQGEEIGMTNPKFALSDYEDVEMIGNYHQFVEQQKTISSDDFLAAAHKVGRDNARTPMQWNDSHNAGFSESTPWFKLNPNYTAINVASDATAEKSVAYYYQQLIRLRHDENILRDGSFELLLPQDPALFVYKRHDGEKTWLVLANLSEQSQDLHGLLADKDYRVILSNYQREAISQQVAPYESFIVELN